MLLGTVKMGFKGVHPLLHFGDGKMTDFAKNTTLGLEKSHDSAQKISKGGNIGGTKNQLFYCSKPWQLRNPPRDREGRKRIRRLITTLLAWAARIQGS